MRVNKKGEALSIKMVHVDEDGTQSFIGMSTPEKADEFVKTDRAEYIDEHTVNVFETKDMMKKTNRQIIERENFICYICGDTVTESTATIDHVIPRSKRSKFSYSQKNRRCCCQRCNKDKSNMTLTEYLNKIEKDKKNYEYISKSRLKKLKEYAAQHEREFMFEELSKIGRIKKA